jgi:hypothetical protein
MGDGLFFAMQPFLVAFQIATIFGCISNSNHFWLQCRWQPFLVAVQSASSSGCSKSTALFFGIDAEDRLERFSPGLPIADSLITTDQCYV